MKRIISFSFIICLFSLLHSCKTKENLIYFNDLPKDSLLVMAINNNRTFEVKPEDILDIDVSTLNQESNMLFNRGVVNSTLNTGSTGMMRNSSTALSEYLVDKDGNINFPVLGKVHVAGLTKEGIRDKMTQLISAYVKDPIVNVRMTNLRFTVLGEIGSPGAKNLSDKKTSIVEAIAISGGMTDFGQKNNVLLIREEEGQRKFIRLDFSKKSIFNSPYYYLQQNDIVYVEPTKVKRIKTSQGWQSISILTSLISTVSILVIAVDRLK